MNENRKLETIAASRILPSTILPARKHGPEIAESVKTVGLLQPIIVRPLTGTDKFEILDGHGRFDAFKGDEPVLIEIREDAVKDSAVFSISEATFRREDRSVFERASFYAKWARVMAAEKGSDIGIQRALAQQTGLSESAICQYTAINDLFEKLAVLAPSEKFSALKNWSVDKLYWLSGLRRENSFLEIAKLFEENIKVTTEQAEEIVRNAKMKTIRDSQIPGGKPSINETVQAALQKKRAEKCRDSAEKITALVDETHERLVKIIKEVANDSEKFSSDEVLQTLRNVFRTLTRLKKYSDALGERMWPDTGNTSATNPASPAS